MPSNMEEKGTPKLSLSDKLDKVMEAIVFQQQLLLTCLKAMDKLLAPKSSIITPV